MSRFVEVAKDLVLAVHERYEGDTPEETARIVAKHWPDLASAYFQAASLLREFEVELTPDSSREKPFA